MTRVSRRVMNLAHLLRQAARRHPGELALIWGDEAWSWAELDARVDALAAVLGDRGVIPGARVLVQARNCNQLIESMFACFRLGAIWVPTNFRQTPEEVAYLAESSGATLMICGAEFPEHATACGIASPIVIAGGGADDFDTLVASRLGTLIRDADVEYDDACWFFYTSGTTGRPKAAVLTHGQMAFVLANHLCDLMPGLAELDASLVVAPLTHGAGAHLLSQVSRCVKTVLPAGDRFDPEEVWRLVEHWKISNMFTVPTIVKMLVEHPSLQSFEHRSLRHVIYAGAPMYRADQKRAIAALGPVLIQYYGLGEVTGAITVLRAEDHDAADGPTVKLATCGRERTGMQVSIQNDGGVEMGAGDTGEICVCGPAVFAGYHNDPAANAKAFRNGWFRTGDLGHMDAEGDLFITGRASDMYISGGSNVYPREIEEKILAHDAIDEVAVVGMPDPVWGEIGVAVCVRRPNTSVDESDLTIWLKKRIASYKMPRRVLFWDALPKSAYGKITKAAVKALVLEQEGPEA